MVNDKMKALRELMRLDDSVVFRYDKSGALWLRNIHVGGKDWAISKCGYGSTFEEALDEYYEKLTDLADEEYVIINAFEHAGPRQYLRWANNIQKWIIKE